MLLARLRARICGGPFGLGVLAAALVLVILALFALGPLAYASPPDQTWVAGIYDAADYDDVVWLLTDTSMARESAQSADITCHLVHQLLTSPPASVRRPLHPGSLNPRGPPIPETAR
jgi:hypothetical protein